MPARKSTRPATAVDPIAERLRLTREAMNLSQAEWCRLVGISVQAWNNYERGVNRISVDQALKVCTAVGVSLDWIYRGIPSALPHGIAVALQERASREQAKHSRA